MHTQSMHAGVKTDEPNQTPERHNASSNGDLATSPEQPNQTTATRKEMIFKKEK